MLGFFSQNHLKHKEQRNQENTPTSQSMNKTCTLMDLVIYQTLFQRELLCIQIQVYIIGGEGILLRNANRLAVDIGDRTQDLFWLGMNHFNQIILSAMYINV
jgi:hypothetical protein